MDFRSKDMSFLSANKGPTLAPYLAASSNAPRAAATAGHRVVQCILHDLDRIKRGRSRRRLQKCEKLIYYIVQQLRSRRAAGGYDDEGVGGVEQEHYHDHLLETTAIWALIHMLRMDSHLMKEVMIGAGVPGILYDIMSGHSLTGATRQYASELCFFLCSTGPMPDRMNSGPTPLSQLPEVHHADKLYGAGGIGRREVSTVGGDDALSLAASELSSLADDKGLHPFVPYRINQENMSKLDGLFDNMSQDGYGNIANVNSNLGNKQARGSTPGAKKKRAAELHSTAMTMSESMFSSRHGFGKTDFLEELDDHSISSSMSSNSQSHDDVSAGMYSIANRLSGLVESQSMRNLQPWQSQSTLDHTLAAASMIRGGDSMSITSASLNSQNQQLQPRQQRASRKLFHMRATPEIVPLPSKSGRTARSSNKGFLDKIISQSNSGHFALDPRFGSSHREQQRDEDEENELLEGSLDSFDGVPLASLRSRTAASASMFGGGGSSQNLAMSPDLRSVSTAPSASMPRGGTRLETSFVKPVRLASLAPPADMAPANRLTASGIGGVLQGSMFSGSSRPGTTGKMSKLANLYGNTPSLDGMDRVGTAPTRGTKRVDLNLSGGVAASRSRLSVDSASEPSDVPSFLAQFDPLSLNVTRGLHAHILDAPSSVLEVNEVNEDDESVFSRSTDSEGDDDDDDDDDHGGGGKVNGQHQPRGKTGEPEYYNTPLGKIEKKKASKKKKKVRVRAEKLVDHRFIKQLFTKKATIEDTQNTVRRLQDMLELVDSDRSGFVTWEAFVRVLLSVAPQHVLRSDVMAFMDAQCDDDQCLIDYREFVISGKVIVVQRQNGRAVLPINGWLERQRLYTGDATTYTWQNHVKWYNARQAQAVIWLMRRSNRAFVKSDLYVKTWRELVHEGKRAKAFEYLKHLSVQAEKADSTREEAKRFILGRALHARLRMLRVSEAQRYLSSLATKVVEMTAIKEAMQEKLRAEEVFVEKKRQVGIERVYWIRFRNIDSKRKLKWYGDRAIRHTIRTERDFKWLQDHVAMVQAQLMLREMAQDWLLRAAERYLMYCQIQDQNLLGLLRIGNKAYAYLDRQIKGLDWLLARGSAGVSHTAKQTAALNSMCVQGRRTLHFLNDRENSFAYCTRRRANADRLIERQKASIFFLRSLVKRLRAIEGSVTSAQEFLAERGRAALVFVNRRDAAQQRLCHIAKRAYVVRRRVLNTFVELQQIGQFARVANFNRYWMGITDNRSRVNEEVRRLCAFDKKVGLTRKDLSQHERWQVELEDAFNTLAANLLLPGESVNDKKSADQELEKTPQLTKIGFVRLLNHGSLLNLHPGEVDEAWRHLDPRSTGFTTFDNLWFNWFENRAVSFHLELVEQKKKSAGFSIVLADIVSPLDRVLFIFKKRFALTEAKAAMRGAQGAEDDEDEDEDGGDGDDDDDDDDDEEEEGQVDEGAPQGYSTEGKTPQEIEYDLLFMRMLGNEEGVQEANLHLKAFEDDVAAKQQILDAQLAAEEAKRLELQERAEAARAKEVLELEAMRIQLGLAEGNDGDKTETSSARG